MIAQVSCNAAMGASTQGYYIGGHLWRHGVTAVEVLDQELDPAETHAGQVTQIGRRTLAALQSFEQSSGVLTVEVF